jgi:hypothetical protein
MSWQESASRGYRIVLRSEIFTAEPGQLAIWKMKDSV